MLPKLKVAGSRPVVRLVTGWGRDPDAPDATASAPPEAVSFREPVDQRTDVRGWIIFIVLLGVVGFLLGPLMHHGCTTAGPPVDRAEPGTPRFVWCRDHEDSYVWLVRLAPPLVVAVLSLLLGRRALLTVAIALLVLVGALILATEPGRLRYYEPLTEQPAKALNSYL